MKKKLAIAGAAGAGLAAASVLGLVLFLDANQFRPQLEQAMGEALGRKVSIGNIEVALLSGGVTIEQLSIADDPAFSSAPFVTAKSVNVGVDLMPLILSRRLQVRTFSLVDPEVTLLDSASGQWNFSGLTATPATEPSAPPSNQSRAAMIVLVERVAIANGKITIRKGESVYHNVNLEATDLSYTSRFPFRLRANTPGGGTITLDGQAGPFNTADAALTSFAASLELADLDLASTGFVDASSGLAGRIHFTGDVASDGQQLASKGQVTATRLRLVPGGTPAAVPIQIDYESSYARKRQAGVVKQGDVGIGKAVAQLTGEYHTAGDTIAVRMKLAAARMPAPDLEAMLPALGMALPAGASLQQGTLDINLAISGPIDRLVIAGPITLSTVTVRGFDLGGKLSAVPALRSVGSVSGAPKAGDTLIETLAVTMRVAPEGIRADDINVVAPAIGRLTGNGTVGPKGDIDFRMRVNSIPFRIQGTLASPTFIPDVGRGVEDLVKNPEAVKKAATALTGLFGGKKR